MIRLLLWNNFIIEKGSCIGGLRIWVLEFSIFVFVFYLLYDCGKLVNFFN